MTTREELLETVGKRYRGSSRAEKSRILEEFSVTTGYHRKHAMRLLRAGPSNKRSAPRPSRRVYDTAAREALVVVWEATDRVCGKRLKAIIPTLLAAMQHHGHLALAPELSELLMKMSAATIDRVLAPQREQCGRRRRQSGAATTIRRSIPVRTFSDWNDPAPGFIEADLVSHSGPVASGSFVQTLVLTDISLPCGTDPRGMPFGFQVVGRFRGDIALLDAAEAIEQAFRAIPALRRPLPDLAKLTDPRPELKSIVTHPAAA